MNLLPTQSWLSLPAALLLALAASPVLAAPPAVVPVQGRLANVAGGPSTDGKYGLQFMLYASLTEPVAYWQETQIGVQVASGMFFTTLGKADPKNPLPIQQLATSAEAWLGVSVDGDPELPRVRLLSVPYAVVAGESTHAQTADALAKPLTADMLPIGFVTSDKINFTYAASNSKGGPALDLTCSGCIDSGEIGNGAVGTNHLMDAAVKPEKLAEQAVTTSKIADESVTEGKLAAGAVTTAKLGNGAVTAAKLGVDWALGAGPGGDAVKAKLAADLQCTGCVATEDLADKSVTTAKLADGAVTAAKLAPDVQLQLPMGAMVVSMSPYDAKLLAAGYKLFPGAMDIRTPRNWKVHAALPTGRLHPAVGVVKNRAYVIGGGGPDHFNGGVTTNEMYDPDADTWTKKADMPTPRGWCGWAVVNDIIYVGGGYKDGAAVAQMEGYDPATDKWTQLAPLPVASGANWALPWNGKAYFFGGTTGQTHIYNPANNTWSQGAATPGGGGEDHSLAEVDGKLYIIGGAYNPDRVLMRRYDPDTNTWEILPQVPNGGVTDGWTYVNGHSIYVWGGWDSFERRLRVFDTDTQTWSVRDNFMPIPPATSGFSRFKIALLNGRAHFLGGGTSSAESVPYNKINLSFGPVEMYLYSH